MIAQKIAVSDYDGTLALDGVVQDSTLAAIEQWRSAGNAFGIATGRDLNMTRHVVERFGIPIDFLVCSNGAGIYNSGFGLIQENTIADSAIPELLLHRSVLESMHVAFCTANGSFVHVQDPETWMLTLGFPVTLLESEGARQMSGVQQVSLAYVDIPKAEEAAQSIAGAFSGKLATCRTGTCMDVMPLNTSKGLALKSLCAISGWNPADLLVIGDGENDLSMLSMFKGFSMDSAEPEIRQAALKTYATVGHMLLDQLESKAA